MQIRVFVPHGLQSSGMLYGCHWHRKEKEDWTIVILGAVQGETLHAHHRAALQAPCLAEQTGLALEWIGHCGDTSKKQSSVELGGVWTEWEMGVRDIHLISVSVGHSVHNSDSVKIFYYDSAVSGIQHDSAQSLGTAFGYAIHVINQTHRIGQVMNKGVSDGAICHPWTVLAQLGCCHVVNNKDSVLLETRLLKQLIGSVFTGSVGRLIHSWRRGTERSPVHRPFLNTASGNVDEMEIKHAILSRIVQWIVSFLLLYNLLRHRQELIISLQEGVVSLSEFLRGHAVWLSGAPAGLKLHKPLAEFYADCLKHTAEGTLWFHQCLIQILTLIWIPLWLSSALVGITLQLAICSDILYIAHLPLILAYIGISSVTFIHVKCLGLTWQLLRGEFAQEKRKRKRRANQERDSVHEHFGHDKKAKDDEVLMEHLIVGVLLFTPLLALMPTTLVFYGFMCTLQLMQILSRSLTATVMNLFISNPFILLCLRLCHPYLYPDGLTVEAMSEEKSEITIFGGDASMGHHRSCWYYRIRAVPASITSLLTSRIQQSIELLWQIEAVKIPFGYLFGLKP